MVYTNWHVQKGTKCPYYDRTGYDKCNVFTKKSFIACVTCNKLRHSVKRDGFKDTKHFLKVGRRISISDKGDIYLKTKKK